MELTLKRCCVFDVSEVAEVGLAEDHFANPSIFHKMRYILKWGYFLAEVLISIPSKGNWIVAVEKFLVIVLTPVLQLDAFYDRPF